MPPPRQRHAAKWRAFLALLMVMMITGVAKAEDHYTPEITDWGGLKLEYPNRMHFYFKLRFFNFHGDNSGYYGRDGVWLTINDVKVCDLYKVWSGIGPMNIKKPGDQEDGLKDNKNSVFGTRRFPAKGETTPTDGKGNFYGGYVAISNMTKSDRDMHVIVDVVLDHFCYDRNLTFGVVGNWVNKDRRVTNNYKVEAHTSYTNIGNWPNMYVKRTGNKEAMFYATEMKVEKYPNKGNKGTQGTWLYTMRFVYNPKNGEEDRVYAPSNTYKIKQYWDNKNSQRQNVNSSSKTCAEGITGMNMTLEIPDNWTARPIYPVLYHYAPDYKAYPSDKNDVIGNYVSFYRYYRDHWINGYPRPNPSGKGDGNSTAANAMRTSADVWTKEVTVSWYPDINDTKHVTTDGQWVVFRKVEGESGTGQKLGTVAYKNEQTTFVDKTAKDYDKKYIYTVVFEPKEWGTTVNSESDAAGLSCSVSAQITRENPLTNLTATDNLDDRVKVTCRFNRLSDASNSKKYTIRFYRRQNGQKEWTQLERKGEISSSTAEEYSFEDTDVRNACAQYQYKAEIDAFETTYVYGDDGTVQGGIDGASSVTSVVASRGAYSGTVRITWEAKQVGTDLTYYNVLRRRLGSTSEKDFQTIYTTSGVAATYSYEDNTAQPGSYYEYSVQCYRKCTEGSTTSMTYAPLKSTDGFAMATGVVSGRIYYDTGTAVDSVKVVLSQTDDSGAVKSAFRAMKGKGRIDVSLTEDEQRALFNGKWTMQTYYKAPYRSGNYNKYAFWSKYMGLGMYGMGTHPYLFRHLPKSGKSEDRFTYFTDITITPNTYYHVALSYNANGSYTLRIIDEEGKMQKQTLSDMSASMSSTVKTNGFCFGSYSDTDVDFCIDECRFWTKELTDAEVMRNYNHTLSGSEEGLYSYFKLDENIPGQKVAYDYSRTDGISNGRHGAITSMSVTEDVPNENQLSLCAYTDQNGNYTISGVPFSGDGTSYTVRPALGIHSFSPAKLNRFVSAQSLVHNGVDFQDVSSFPVSGTVYYDGTLVPVEGAQFAVDGVTCARDGKIITTDADGRYTISVPIGFHYISVSKEGHTFANADGNTYDSKGYYPSQIAESDARQTTEFTKAITNLPFYDTTLVPVAGRVSGGSVENEKPLCLGESVNNIGVATITLKASDVYSLNVEKKTDGSSYEYATASADRQFALPEGVALKSTATAGSGNESNARLITIKTDPETGEFAAMLPPLNYTVTKVAIDSNSDISWSDAELIDATNVNVTKTDSVLLDNGQYQKFEYVASYKKNYRSESILDITQKGAAAEGAFGDQAVSVAAKDGSKADVALYNSEKTFRLPLSADEEAYTFGYPVFQEGMKYDFQLKLYEKYVNHDANAPVKETTVPLGGTTVTLTNQLGMGTSVVVSGEHDGEVYEANETEIELDSLGCGTYRWRAGMPNILEPYTRTLTATYPVDGVVKNWQGNGFQGIILGELTSGNNFVTSGPDEVLMILRDPAGSASSAFIEEGYTNTVTKMRGGKFLTDDALTLTAKAGLKTKIITGTAVGGLVATTTEMDVTLEGKAGLHLTEDVQTANTTVTTTTATKRISTSDQPEYVGAGGDVFIGASTNYSFGKARQIGIHMADANAKPELKKEEVMSMSTNYSTDFSYSQNYVENELIPNFRRLRNSCLVHVDSYDGFVNNTDSPVYITKLSADDERYGTNNNDAVWGSLAAQPGELSGESYKMVLPQSAYIGDKLKDDYIASDTIKWFNAQIKAWEQVLANNEKVKVDAIDNSKYKRDNYSFDSGASVSMEKASSTSQDYTVTSETTICVVGGLKSGAAVNGVGMEVETSWETGGGAVTSDSETDEKSRTVGFTLMETGNADALSIDVIDAPDNFGPVFYTRGGQTSCPFEDEVKTKYYRPGTVIQQKTMQVEMPQISAKETSVTGVPSGKPATFTLYLQNISEAEKDCYFNLDVDDKTNPNGAAVTMDGRDITGGRTVYVPAGETVSKTVQIQQTNPDVYDYRNLRLRLSSTCDDNIEASVELSAYFQQTSSDISLRSEESALNIETGTQMHLTIGNYDKNSRGLQSVRLQAQPEGNPQWITVGEWMVDAKAAEDNGKQTLPDEGTFSYVLDMSNQATYPDGQWNLRAITVSRFGGEEITKSSELISFYKDMSRPQLISNPNPANGVLTADGEISLTFNEDIRYGALTRDANFSVKGALNDARVDHAVAMSLTGGEGAKTDARIDLAGKSFAINMWLRYSAAGEIVGHGTAASQLTASVNADDKLVVSIGGKEYVSDSQLKKDTWQFLSLSYDADKEAISANCAYDAFDVTLFANKQVGAYAGNGALALGTGIKGQIHEVSLWNTARPWSEAQSEMYERKSRYTSGLIGYWRFDEGHGQASADCARSRNMTMPENAWYIASRNYALELDGDHVAAVDLSKVAASSSDSYLMEFWMRADESQKGRANVIGFNATDKLNLYLDEEGKLQLQADGTSYSISTQKLTDSQWHHVALNVMKSTQGTATVYLDGAPAKQMQASAMPSLQTSKLIIGGRFDGEQYSEPLRGAVDELRIWTGRMTADVINNNMYTRVSPTADALAAYYPFEKAGLDEGNQPVMLPTLDDQSITASGAAAVASGLTALDLSADNAMALKPAPAKENVSFDFVGSDRKVLIKLTDSAQRLENSTLTITVKGVRDSHNNTCEAVTWDVLVKQNQLLWQQSEATAVKHGTERVAIDVPVKNQGASVEAWTISGMPSWLTVADDKGYLPALSTGTVRFEVDPGLTIGNHEATVYLTGSLGIPEPLSVSVVSTSQAPDWNVDPSEYELTMNVNGQLIVDGKLSQDENDIVAAFRGPRCVGVASPVYYPRYDAYYVLLNVYGNMADSGQPLTYKVFDAATGRILPSVAASESAAQSFVPDRIIGTMAEPNIWTAAESIEQPLQLKSGWQWVSMYVEPQTADCGELLKDVKESVNTVIGENGQWTPASNTLVDMGAGRMYKMQMNSGAQLSVVGNAIDVKQSPVVMRPYWNWIGYKAAGYVSLADAFADLEPQNGDVVKSQTAFATWQDTEWVGSLYALQAGEGYQYRSSRQADRTFFYPEPTGSARKAKAMTEADDESESLELQKEIAMSHSGNMNVIAHVVDADGMTRTDAVVSVVDEEGQLRGICNATSRDLYFMTIAGENRGAALSFVVTLDGRDYAVAGTMFYADDAVMGSISEPLLIDLGSATGIGTVADSDSSANAAAYDLSGKRAEKNLRQQTVIMGGKKIVKLNK